MEKTRLTYFSAILLAGAMNENTLSQSTDAAKTKAYNVAGVSVCSRVFIRSTPIGSLLTKRGLGGWHPLPLAL